MKVRKKIKGHDMKKGTVTFLKIQLNYRFLKVIKIKKFRELSSEEGTHALNGRSEKIRLQFIAMTRWEV